MLTWHGLGLNQFFLSVLDKIAPFKTIRIKQRTQPWMSTEMIKLINLRDTYLRQFRKSKNQSDYELFIYHRNQVKYKKEKDKSQYYINVVNENKNRPKKLWPILKEVGSSTKCKTKESSISLDIGNELCFDKVKVATHSNDFFTSNAASLVNKLPACSGQFGQSHVVEFYRNKHVTEDMFSLANVTVGQLVSSVSPQETVKHWTRARWAESWASTTTRLHKFMPTPSNSGQGVGLSRRAWTRLNRLRTGVGRFGANMLRWGLSTSDCCDCGAEQPADHITSGLCPIHRPPEGIHGLIELDVNTRTWLENCALDV